MKKSAFSFLKLILLTYFISALSTNAQLKLEDGNPIAIPANINSSTVAEKHCCDDLEEESRRAVRAHIFAKRAVPFAERDVKDGKNDVGRANVQLQNAKNELAFCDPQVDDCKALEDSVKEAEEDLQFFEERLKELEKALADAKKAVGETAAESARAAEEVKKCLEKYPRGEPGKVPDIVLYRDKDGDKYGSTRHKVEVCDSIKGYVSEGGDCDDDDTRYHPNAPEEPGDPDYNCDGFTMEAPPSNVIVSCLCLNGQNELSWHMDVNLFIEKYAVEGSHDGANWNLIQNLSVSGLSQARRKSSLKIAQAGSIYNFYRVIATDRQAKKTYSNVVGAACISSVNIQVFPNPSSGVARIQILSKVRNAAKWELYNPNGVVVREGQVNLQIGNNQLSADLSHLSNGVYTFVIRAANLYQITRIIKP